jgi:CheY-like chemotaxis protein
MTPPKKVLVVDDDSDDRDLIKKVFKECADAVDIVELSDGSEVMNYLTGCTAAQLPSVILLDLNMPVMNGFEVLMEIKTNDKLHQIPVYVFTTSNQARDRVHSVRLGANGMITKPASYEAWIETLCPLV